MIFGVEAGEGLAPALWRPALTQGWRDEAPLHDCGKRLLRRRRGHLQLVCTGLPPRLQRNGGVFL